MGRTRFTRNETVPVDMLAIGYDLEDVLREQGIIGPPEADPFPGISTDTGYDSYTRA